MMMVSPRAVCDRVVRNSQRSIIRQRSQQTRRVYLCETHEECQASLSVSRPAGDRVAELRAAVAVGIRRAYCGLVLLGEVQRLDGVQGDVLPRESVADRALGRDARARRRFVATRHHRDTVGSSLGLFRHLEDLRCHSDDREHQQDENEAQTGDRLR